MVGTREPELHRGTEHSRYYTSTLTFRADQGDACSRLDRALPRHWHTVSGLSRTRVQQWSANGRVTVNEAPMRRAASTVPLVAELSVGTRLWEAAAPGPLDVAFEDGRTAGRQQAGRPRGAPVIPQSDCTLLHHALLHVRHHTPETARAWLSRLG